ncbi:testicular acid phosphatase homolog [Tribolium castaneum]|nr:PREDICTED: testicular acid phosphatase homolog [Tribolium castaneum]|eukprot:XP_008193226.1 PREDICTED: testicular acid phosphatase homolog [Tribolium castaneum]
MFLKCPLSFLMLIASVGIIPTNSTLTQLHIVFRHGERAPTETYKNDPHINVTWSGGWGQLTNRGKLEMYLLGLKMRQLYHDFIPKYYFPDEVKVMSSYADRCLMSAQALLAGLFPPRDDQVWNKDLLWQPIPVHYVPRSQDNLIAMKAKCKKYDEEFADVFHSEAIKKIDEENKELYDYLTKNTGQKMDSVGKVELLYNTLEIERLHNLTPPSWTQNVSWEQMRKLAARSLETFTETNFMKRMKGGVFLSKVITDMETDKKSPLLFLYAAHDLTLVNILKTLGYKTMLKPGFGASLVFELRNNSQITLLYRDDIKSDPERIAVESCNTPCLLSGFKTALKEFLPSNWKLECNQ